MMYVTQNIMLYILNLHSAVYINYYLNKTGRKKKNSGDSSGNPYKN